MKLVNSLSIKWDEKEGYSKKVIVDEIEKRGLVVQEVRIKPGEIAKTHYHKKQTEIFYFLNNNGKWIINGSELKPDKGDTLIIEANDRHEVMNESNEDYLYVAYKYDYDPEDLYWE